MALTNVAWVVDLLCVLFSARIATAFLRHNPRLFTVMALFACSWTLVQGFYRAPGEATLRSLISDIASFLFVYIGGLLIVETHSTTKYKEATVPLQSIALLLLVIIAAPKDFSVPLPGGGSVGLSTDQSKATVSFAFDLAASISIILGTYGIAAKRLYIPLLLVLSCYIVIDMRHFYHEIMGGSAPLTVFEMVAFAGLNAAFTLIFGAIVAYHGMTQNDRQKGWIYWVLHFFGVAGPASGANATQPPPLG